jgi:2-keto-4-pentenoate hydratase
MFDADAAARFLDEAHRSRARYQNLPENISPKSVAEAYATQAALLKLW